MPVGVPDPHPLGSDEDDEDCDRTGIRRNKLVQIGVEIHPLSRSGSGLRIQYGDKFSVTTEDVL